jgi:hypothetical protein
MMRRQHYDQLARRRWPSQLCWRNPAHRQLKPLEPLIWLQSARSLPPGIRRLPCAPDMTRTCNPRLRRHAF